MRQRDNVIGAVVSAFIGGTMRERDSRGGERLPSMVSALVDGAVRREIAEGGSVWRRREKKDKIVFLNKFIQ